MKFPPFKGQRPFCFCLPVFSLQCLPLVILYILSKFYNGYLQGNLKQATLPLLELEPTYLSPLGPSCIIYGATSWNSYTKELLKRDILHFLQLARLGGCRGSRSMGKTSCHLLVRMVSRKASENIAPQWLPIF